MDLFKKALMYMVWPLENVTATILVVIFRQTVVLCVEKNIFDKYVLYMYDSFKTGHFLLKTTQETMILSLLKFLHTYMDTHTLLNTHTYIYENLAKDNDMENGTREVCCFI